jgi:UDPglucose 6-dehydrogenase
MAAALASKGFEVIVCDVDPKKVQAINDGQAPVQETGLQGLIFANRERLRATSRIEEAVRFADITFVVTATPSSPDGRFSLEYILPACEEIGRVLGRPLGKVAFHPVVITSTVMPGDTWGQIRETLEKHSHRKCGEEFGLAYNPEFIALGSVIHDFLNPDFVLLGASDPLTEARISAVYKKISDAPIACLPIVDAEIAKLAINSYITTKISFANMLSRICSGVPNSNVDNVTRAMGMDSRIGGKYLKGGVSYGGPCFPRDNRALATLGQSFPLVVDSFNRAQITYLASFVRENTRGPIAILGTNYKVGTDVVTESAGSLLHAELAEELCTENESPETIVVMLPDPKFQDIDFSGRTVIDPWRAFGYLAEDSSVTYIPLGIGPRE